MQIFLKTLPKVASFHNKFHNKSKALCATTVFFGSGNELLNSENELLINEDLSNRNAV